MNNMTVHGVVDRMSSELATRRRKMLHRHSAYLALVRAILSEEQSEQPTQLATERHPASIGQSQAAA